MCESNLMEIDMYAECVEGSWDFRVILFFKGNCVVES